MKAAGDHEVQDEKEFFTSFILIEDEDDAFAEASQAANGFAFDGLNRRNCCAEKQRARDAELLKRLADYARCERREICRNVRKFRHANDEMKDTRANLRVINIRDQRKKSLLELDAMDGDSARFIRRREKLKSSVKMRAT
jgi:hypothetical protein